MICPLCNSKHVSEFSKDRKRNYFKCLDCTLVFVPQVQHISFENEKARYDAHQNDEKSPSYQKYFSDILSKIENLKHLKSSLDFGCGRSLTLKHQIEKLGLFCQVYDLYYHPDQHALNQTYDIIFMIEVIEHVRSIEDFLEQLKSCLHSDSQIVIKTSLYPDLEKFENWYYKRDMTHVHFFSIQSLEYLAKKLNRKTKVLGDDLFILK